TAAADLAAAVEADARHRLETLFAGSLRRVINATGVIVHTNLGRAPLGPAALDRIVATAGGYTNLEYDVARGRRGSRAVHAEQLVTMLTGAEAAVVVNNNAAATLLMLAALAAGREVLISRGELVEIGGGFRVPDVMAQSGARLREVGTTNRTRIADYRAAAGPRTAAILRVHPSNFRVEGFAERPTLGALVAEGRELGLPVLEDAGSGNLERGPVGEPAVRDSIAAGADLVCCSGDKLLGGPQAGVMLGRREWIERCRRHPLARAFRADKFTLAGLTATLLHYARGEAQREVPVIRMLAMSKAEVAARAEKARSEIGDWLLANGLRAELVDGESTVGGGALPGETLPTTLIALTSDARTPHEILAGLRARGVIARITDDRVTLDLRTVLDDAELVQRLRSV
ncbi:MAG: L-seryl-tRNA(Sec) selenium transferase, partial [Candidatus Brachytrichaceae bacterium NZ_4S206]